MPLVLAGVFCLSFLATTASYGQPAPMKPARLVNDYASLFTPEQTRVLEDSLVAFDRATSTQIAVVTLSDLGNMTPNEMATAIIEKWGVGRAGKDNGIVILIKPRNEHGRGEVYIGTGRGAEGALPDGKATRIIDKYMIPSLKNGDYFTAVYDGSAVIRSVLRGEFDAEKDDPSVVGSILSLVFGLVFVIFIIISIGKSAKNGGDDGSSGSSGGGSGPIILGGLGGFCGSRGGGGGFGGGGFGGFGGGGSFGGGGGRGF